MNEASAEKQWLELRDTFSAIASAEAAAHIRGGTDPYTHAFGPEESLPRTWFISGESPSRCADFERLANNAARLARLTWQNVRPCDAWLEALLVDMLQTPRGDVLLDVPRVPMADAEWWDYNQSVLDRIVPPARKLKPYEIGGACTVDKVFKHSAELCGRLAASSSAETASEPSEKRKTTQLPQPSGVSLQVLARNERLLRDWLEHEKAERKAGRKPKMSPWCESAFRDGIYPEFANRETLRRVLTSLTKKKI